MTAQALVIDGPMKGQLIPGDQLPVVYIPDGETTPRAYWTHTWTMLGRAIRIQSVHADPAEIGLDVLWGMFISPAAKSASDW